MSRKSLSFAVIALLGVTGAVALRMDGSNAIPADGPVVTVYKSPTCGCCNAWIEHLEAAGFTVRAVNTDNIAGVKTANGVPGKLASCHTALVDGYVLEGHVPADLVKKLLAERPAVAGLAVPGMPAGSPGMEVGQKDPYSVVAFDRQGGTTIYATR